MRENTSLFLFIPDFASMPRTPPLLLLLSLLIMSFGSLAEETARHPPVSGERRLQMPDSRRDAKHLEEKRRLKHLWLQLSHEERDALRQQMRANWARMTPEERQQLHQAYRGHRERREDKKKRGEGRDPQQGKQAELRDARRKAHEAYWQSLSPGEREALRHALREALRHWQHEGAARVEAPPGKALPAENTNEKGKTGTLPPEAH
jgi:predicted Fe-S protein YdhL (DUF1289 family)